MPMIGAPKPDKKSGTPLSLTGLNHRPERDPPPSGETTRQFAKEDRGEPKTPPNGPKWKGPKK